MACNTAGLGVMYLHRGFGPKLVSFDIEKAGRLSAKIHVPSYVITYLT